MALKHTYEKLDDIPEALRTEYTEQDDGTWVLAVTDLDSHPSVRAMKNALTRQKTLRETDKNTIASLQARVEGLPDDFDADAYQALLQRAEANNTNTPEEMQKRLDAQKQQLEKTFSKTETGLREQIDRLDKSLRTVLIDDGLTKELVALGCKKELLPAAKALLKEQGKIKILQADDGSFRPVADDGIESEAPLADFVKKWAQDDEGKAFIEKPSGGGSKGANGVTFPDNPFAKETFNLTRQNEIMAKNPEQARQMAGAAGVKLPV